MSTRQLTHRTASSIGMIAVCVAMVPFSLLATNDGPRHLLAAAVHHTPDFFPCFEPHSPITSAFMPELFGPFLAFFSAETAGEIVGRLVTIFIALAATFAARGLGASPGGLVLAPLAALSQAVALGFVPYEMGVALGFLAIASACRSPNPLAIGATALLLLLAARLHVVAAAAAGLVCAAILVDRLGVLRGVAIAAALAAAPASIALQLFGESRGVGSKAVVFPSLTAQLPAVGRFLWPIPPPLGLLGALVLAGLVFWGLARRRTWVLGVGALFFVASLVVPTDVVGWQYGGLRTLPFFVVIAASTFPERLGRQSAVVALVVAIGFGVGARQAAAALGPFRADIDRLTAPPRLEMEIGVGDIVRGFFGANEPIWSLGQLISLRFGNMSLLGQHTMPSIHSILERCSRPDLPPSSELQQVQITGNDKRQLANVITWASHADGLVLVVGEPALVSGVEDAIAFEPREVHTHLRVGTQRTCPVRVEVIDAVADLDVAVGYDTAHEPARIFGTTTGGHLSMELPLPCGARQLQVTGSGRCAEGSQIHETAGALTCHWQADAKTR